MDKLYEVAIVFMIKSTNGLHYIGSTHQPVKRILSQIKYDYRRFIDGRFGNCESFKLFDNNSDVTIETLGTYTNISKRDLHQHHREFILEYKDKLKDKLVNTMIPLRTRKEYQNDNKEECKRKKRVYRENNKEKITQREKEYK